MDDRQLVACQHISATVNIRLKILIDNDAPWCQNVVIQSIKIKLKSCIDFNQVSLRIGMFAASIAWRFQLEESGNNIPNGTHCWQLTVFDSVQTTIAGSTKQ